MIKRSFITFLTLFLFTPSVFALNRDGAIAQYRDELMSVGMEQEDAQDKAEKEVDALISTMNSSQSDVAYSYEAVAKRVDSLLSNDGRKEDAEDALGRAENRKEDFVDMNSDQMLEVLPAVGGTLPRVVPDSDFEIAEEEAVEAISNVNRILIAPARPGAVPEGDIVEDFLPQLIRQLFRFAWLAVLVAMVVSAIMLIMAHDNEEKVTKAKQMITYSLIGFAFITLAFALVKAITDIDFFRFI